MMNRRSSRLVAWLLTLVMILNIAPVTAFADNPSSNSVKGPSTGIAPDENVSDFTIQYVIRGQYTYDGVDTVLTDETQYHQSGNPSRVSPKSIDNCSTDGNSRSWDSQNSTLTFFPTPNTASVELRYELVFENPDGSLGIRTFQIMQNGEGCLYWDRETNVKESLEFKEFLKAIYGQEGGDFYTLSQINGKDIRKVLPFDLPSKYTSNINNFEVTSSFSDGRPGNPYTISYMGHDNGRGLEGSINISEIDPSQYTWDGKAGKVCLYYRLKAADDSDATYYTVTWLNDDNSELAKIQVRDGYTPVYPYGTPSKSNPAADKEYSFDGWTPEIVPVTGDATYTAKYTESERTGSDTFTIRFVLEGTDQDIADPLTGQQYQAWNVPTAVVVPSSYSFEGYEYVGIINQQVQIPQSEVTDGTVILYYKQAASKTYTVRFVLEGTDQDIADPLTDQPYKDWGVPTAVVVPSSYSFEGYEYVGIINQQVQIPQSEVTNDTVILYYKTIPTVIIRYVLTSDSAEPQGYTLPSDETAHPGETVTFAAKPSIPGYTFDGWKRYGQYDSILIPTNGVNNGEVFEVEGKFTEQQVHIQYMIEDENNSPERGHFTDDGTGHGWFRVVSEKDKILTGRTAEGQETYTTKYVFTHWTVKIGNDEYYLEKNPTARKPHITPRPDDDPAVTDENGLFTDRTYFAHFQEVVLEEYEIVITGNSATGTYNGETHSVNGYSVSAYDESITLNGPAQNDTKVSLEETNAGTYTMAMSRADFTATSSKYQNIKITVIPGTLTIDPAGVKLTANSGTETYDGSEKTVTGFRNSVSGLTFDGVSATGAAGLTRLADSESTWALIESVTDWILVTITESVATCKRTLISFFVYDGIKNLTHA